MRSERKSVHNDSYQAASMYYVQGETMDTIARQLGTSRSTVSRLLKQARESGIVQISVSNPTSPHSNVARILEKKFKIRTTIVTVKSGTSDQYRLAQVARIAGQLVSQMVQDSMVIGIAWGTTLDTVVQYLIPREVFGTIVVQMNGAANQQTTGIPYVGSIITRVAEAFGSQIVHFPVPAFFDYNANRDSMFKERSVRAVRDLQQRVDLAIFGVGSPVGTMPSHVYRAGYLDESDVLQLRKDRVVGDVNTVFLREDGSWADIALNSRASGLNPNELRQIPRRLCVVAGSSKAHALLGALRAGVVTDLVIDEMAARSVVELLSN